MSGYRCPRGVVVGRLFLLLLLLAAPVPAAWATATCTVSVPALSFGVYDTVNTLDVNTTLTINCTHSGSGSETVSYTLALSSGSGSYTGRTMASGGNSLTYNLYTASNYQTVWGDGTGVTGTVAGSLATINNGHPTQAGTATIYGQIVGGQDVAPGSYATTTAITVTMSF